LVKALKLEIDGYQMENMTSNQRKAEKKLFNSNLSLKFMMDSDDEEVKESDVMTASLRKRIKIPEVD